jgi:hypothetical protein
MSSIKRAHHDLNDVRILKISGWPGEMEVVPRQDDSGWVTVEAPERHEGEYWTFQRPIGGILTCFSSLIGSPDLANQCPPFSQMTVRMPADRIDGLVKVVRDPTGPDGEEGR